MMIIIGKNIWTLVTISNSFREGFFLSAKKKGSLVSESLFSRNKMQNHKINSEAKLK